MLAARIEEAARSSFAQVADQAAAITRGRLHTDTGATAGSVYTDAGPAGVVVGMGEGVDYAQYEEYGGRGFPHSDVGNFLYPSAMGMEPSLVLAAERTADTEIGGMQWPSP